MFSQVTILYLSLQTKNRVLQLAECTFSEDLPQSCGCSTELFKGLIKWPTATHWLHALSF